jgi:hypothetical protein
MLNAVTSGAKGLAPASGGGTVNYLRADASWASPTQGAKLAGCYEDTAAVTPSGGVATLNYANSSVFTLTLTANASLSITNVPASEASSVTILVTQSGGPWTLTYPANTKWVGGAGGIPDISGSGVHIITLFTPDGGTTWYGGVVGQGFA